MALTIAGDSIHIDYGGTDPQVDRAINCALCYTYAMSVYGVKVCTSPTLPNNEGAFRPIAITAPEGCIVNPSFPASGGSRMLIGHYLPMLVFGCLGQIVPERVMAACGSPMWGMNQSGVRAVAPGEKSQPYANMFFFNGGMGATMQGDGQSCLSWPSNVSSTSVEISEHLAPLRFHYKRLRPGSGGPGRHRGGLGQEILIESRSTSPIAVSFLAERTVFPAFGIEGGAPVPRAHCGSTAIRSIRSGNISSSKATPCCSRRQAVAGMAIPLHATRMRCVRMAQLVTSRRRPSCTKTPRTQTARTQTKQGPSDDHSPYADRLGRHAAHSGRARASRRHTGKDRRAVPADRQFRLGRPAGENRD
jgi:N-methylhydantoinase B/oxoprolinase/acetone carboxylase alpha subunit